MDVLELFNRLEEYENKAAMHPDFLFRGQSDSSWSLEPTFSRIAKKRSLGRIKALQLERECVNKFSISARNLLPLKDTVMLLPQNGQIDFLGWFPIMQHFSAPTRKLDWSCSYWVALYFACSENLETDGVIWVADFNKLTSHANDKVDKLNKSFQELMTDPNSDELVVTTMPNITNERVEAQQGRFTVSTSPLSNHETILSSIDAVNKIIIPAVLKPEIMTKLLNMNINAKTLYPGIDGLGKSMKEYCDIWDENSLIT